MSHEEAQGLRSAWKDFALNEHPIDDAEKRAEGIILAQRIMRRARHNVEALIRRLTDLGYRFAFPSAVHVYPIPGLEARLAGLEAHGLFVPISVRAWFEEVGSVNLMGSMPAWPVPAYLFDPNWEGGEPWYTDPLVVEDANLDDTFENWNHRRQLGVIRTCAIEIAPDAAHKANISGGASYEVAIDKPRFDAILANEPHGVCFVDYLELAFRWGGFPGFESIKELPLRTISELCAGLLPL